MIESKVVGVLVVLSMVGAGVQGLAVELPEPKLSVPNPSGLEAVWDEADQTEAFARALMAADASGQARLLSAKAGVQPLLASVEVLDLEQGLDRLLERGGRSVSLEQRAAFQEQRDRMAPELEEMFEELVSAMVRALDLRDQAFAGLSNEEQERLHALLPYLENAFEGEGAPAGPVYRIDATGTWGAGPDGSSLDLDHTQRQAEARTLLERVEPGALHGSASVLLQAAEDALMRLEALGGDGPVSPTPTSAGCDVLELEPVICVRGDSDSVWHKDWWLAVDLGGDNVYHNNQGATRFPQIPVALLLDVSGNDTYGTPVPYKQFNMPENTDWVVAQGAGVLGVGVLVDGGGDDTYEADGQRANLSQLTNGGVYTVAQGAGLAGAGALVSFGGNDNFTARSENLAFRAVVTAQGAARYEALGLLSRPGEGATHYDASAESLPHRWTSTIGVNATLTQNHMGAASIVAQGAGAGAVAALVDAAGDDTYRTHAVGIPVQIYAQGAGFFGPSVPGLGVLVDGGGNDTMDAQALFLRDQHTEILQTCADNQTCDRGHGFTVMESTVMRLFAQGAGDFGTGLLVDLGDGDHNKREVVGHVRYNLTLHIHLEAGEDSRGNLSTWATLQPLHTAIFAQGATVLGTGVLLSNGTNDNAYRIEAQTHAHVVSFVTGSDNPFASAVSRAGDTRAWGQGYAATGTALFLDRDGHDHYGVEMASSVSASGGNVSIAQEGDEVWGGRGVAFGPVGLGVFADLGGDDEYQTVPGDFEAGGNDRCWVNPPQGVSAALGFGVDAEAPYSALLGEGCATGLPG